GLALEVRDLVQHPTPRALAGILGVAESRASYTPLLPLRTTGTRPPLFCVHPASGLARGYRTLAEHLTDSPGWGLEARGLDGGDEPHATIEEMASAYLAAIREIQPSGPYRLLGWSLGGCIAHAIACRLETEGEVVSELVLLDTPTHPGASAEPP